VAKAFTLGQNNANVLIDKIKTDGDATRTAVTGSVQQIASANAEKINADGNSTRAAITEVGNKVASLDTRVNELTTAVGTLTARIGSEDEQNRQKIGEAAGKINALAQKLETPPAPPSEPAPIVQSAPAMQTSPSVASSVQAVTPSPQATPTSNGNGVTVVQNTHERKMSRSGQWTVTTFEKGTVSDYYSEEQFTAKCVGLGSESGVHAKLFYKKNWVSEPWTKDVEVTPGVPFDIHGAYRVVFYSDTTNFSIWTKEMPQSR
jgi:hypothetical protein